MAWSQETYHSHCVCKLFYFKYDTGQGEGDQALPSRCLSRAHVTTDKTTAEVNWAEVKIVYIPNLSWNEFLQSAFTMQNQIEVWMSRSSKIDMFTSIY